MADTIDIPLYQHFDLIRLFSRVESSRERWDEPYTVTGATLNILGKIVGPLLANEFVTPELSATPSSHHSDYDATIVVDASATGCGAFARIDDRIYEVKMGFHKLLRHSAHAEPIGATELLRWVRNKGAKKIALVTDHNAMVWGQKRPISGKGGFSKAFFLNSLFQELYDNGGGQVFYVEGEHNPADKPSRGNRLGDPLSARQIHEMTFPSLAEFKHPYAEKRERPWWNV